MHIIKYVDSAGLAVGGLVGVGVQPAAAGCSVNIEVHNVDDVDSQIDWSDSQVKIRYGTWRVLGSSTQDVDAGDEIVRNVNLTFGCSTDRQYRFEFIQGGNRWTEHLPSSSSYTDNQTVHVHIDR